MQYVVKQEDYIHGGTQKDFYGPSDVEPCLCPLCNTGNFETLYLERGHLGIAQCKTCSLLYTNPRAKSAETNYFGEAGVFFSEARLVFQGKKPHHRDRNYLHELAWIQKFKPHGKLLDIGCNMGFFLRKAKALGYETTGVEPSPSLAKIATEQFALSVVNDFFEENTFPPKHFDVITMIDVFEHVTHPQQILQHVHRALKDDGILCIKVPNGDYNLFKLTLAKLMGREGQHSLFNSYEHVVHYTPATMKKMLEKNGFEIKKFVLPLPIHPPVWANLVGHYYQYPSPFILDWKRITVRNIFYQIGKAEKMLGLKIRFAPDLMFIIQKKKT